MEHKDILSESKRKEDLEIIIKNFWLIRSAEIDFHRLAEPRNLSVDFKL